MDYDGFIKRWLGKSIDWDGVYGPQCVDEIAQYCVENGVPVAYANAKDWANHPALQGAFNWTQNNPNDYLQTPKRGDIIVWGGGLPGSGGYGHIAIFDMIVRPGIFQSLDQNWGGQYVHFIPNHNWDYILGWWALKAKPAPPAPTPPPPGPIPAPNPIPDPAPANPVPVTPATPPTPDPTPVPIPPIVDTVNETNEIVKENNTLLKQILALLQGLVIKFTNIFK